MSAPLKDKDCIIAIFDSFAKTVMKNECRNAVDEEKRKREAVKKDLLHRAVATI